MHFKSNSKYSVSHGNIEQQFSFKYYVMLVLCASPFIGLLFHRLRYWLWLVAVLTILLRFVWAVVVDNWLVGLCRSLDFYVVAYCLRISFYPNVTKLRSGLCYRNSVCRLSVCNVGAPYSGG